VSQPEAVGLEAVAAPAYAEPDFVQRFPYGGVDGGGLESFTATTACTFADQDAGWPVVLGRFAWHLDDDFSGLRAARERVGPPAGRPVRVAILDTGYDPDHVTLPQRLRADLQRNFAGGDPADAADPNRHFPLNQPGHGTATLALLAGNRVPFPAGRPDDFLGGAPFAEVVPVRIADSVIHFADSAMAAGIDYATAQGCDVVSLSMGGVPSRAWADAVNRAYEAGVAIFAAAGNRIGPSPPSSTVYPARFDRVVGVCGVTAARTPYFIAGLHARLQGCFGPPQKMATALAAYTPNVPWAVMGCAGLVNRNGNGTSSATPQAAAAAALWLQQAAVPAGIEPWQKVEAVRFALFSSADKDVTDRDTYYGQGLLRAAQALDVPFRTDLPKAPLAEVSFPWLRLLGVLEAVAAPEGRERMYEVEALQVYEQSLDLKALTGGADPLADPLDPATRKRLLEALRDSPLISKSLRDYLTGRLQGP
jgi:subtilisin family serine protease